MAATSTVLLPAFLGLIGGSLSWVITNFFAQPIVKFFEYRTSAAKLLEMYQPVDDDQTDPRLSSADWHADRKKRLAECGGDLMGFANANRAVTRLLFKAGYNPWGAGFQLQRIAYLPLNDQDTYQALDWICQYLKLAPMRGE
jgi:hypothetical protein